MNGQDSGVANRNRAWDPDWSGVVASRLVVDVTILFGRMHASNGTGPKKTATVTRYKCTIDRTVHLISRSFCLVAIVLSARNYPFSKHNWPWGFLLQEIGRGILFQGAVVYVFSSGANSRIWKRRRAGAGRSVDLAGVAKEAEDEGSSRYVKKPDRNTFEGHRSKSSVDQIRGTRKRGRGAAERHAGRSPSRSTAERAPINHHPA
jgi:hypothetical protein